MDASSGPRRHRAVPLRAHRGRRLSDDRRTLDVPALLRSVPIEGRVLEPAAGRGHLSFELRRAGLEVASFDLHRYANPLVPDVEKGDIRRLTTLEGFAWVVTNLPYGDLEELATHLIGLGVRDHCAWRSCPRRVDRSQGAPQAGARTPALRRRRDADGKAALGGAGAGQRIASSQFRLGGVGRDAAHRRPLAAVCWTMILKGIARARFCHWHRAGVTPQTSARRRPLVVSRGRCRSRKSAFSRDKIPPPAARATVAGFGFIRRSRMGKSRVFEVLSRVPS